MQPFEEPKIKAIFDAYPADLRDIGLQIRDLIFEVAAETSGVGKIEEALRWGQPSYLTPETKSGSTLRIGLPKDGGCGLFAHCGTNIISTYAATFPGTDQIDGNRGVIFENAAAVEPDRLRLLIHHGLTYHQRK